MRPLSPEEIDVLAKISVVSFVVGAAALLSIVVAASVVAYKTKLPGRRSILSSLLLLPFWWGFEQYMGGSLEMTFGPVALLGTAIVYSTIAVIFAAGYLRMCFGFLKQRAANAHRE